MADKPVKKVPKSTQIKANLRRKKVEDGVIAGKTEKQIAAESGISRDRVKAIKAEPEFKERIAARCEDAASLTANEVIGTLANQMRSDVTDLFTEDGAFDMQALREKRLGHLIKKIKVRREFEGRGDDKQPVDIVEIEVHNSQSAAIQLSKILGIEQLPQSNSVDAEKWKKIALDISTKHKRPFEEVAQELIARKPELATLFIQ